MKKLLLIMAAFCLTLINLQAAAIEDKDFEQFFKEFQDNVKQRGLVDTYSTYFDLTAEEVDHNDGYASTSLDMIIYFYDDLKKYEKAFLKLSKKNNYEVVAYQKKYKNNLYDRVNWSVHESWTHYGQGKSYCLSLGTETYDKQGNYIYGCIFAKVKDHYGTYSWKIVGIYSVG